ncbi:hypothetical protein [Clostridium manihotivorum]|uniref:DUF3953 domain-containing protein n=1 Tax=Clostridium manihotivorum TaxID=2320868 RepID=A0A3R5TFN2_9CLOT|nr:hypothetical protein [Clostridium manihotivorum]QAA32296.1 hypothetical protein C1I91_11980 [Clostridium manihotivorum]
MKYTWSKKTTDEKVLAVMSGICSISIIILVVIQLLGVWKNAINVFEPLLGVVMLIQTIQNWRKSKSAAIVTLFAAILIFVVSILVFITK